MNKYVTVKTITEEADVHERTVRRWISSGELPAIRFGEGCVRVPRSAWEAFRREYRGAA